MSKAGLYKPPMNDVEKAQAKEALDKILSEDFGGNKNKMAQEFGFTRNAVSFWFSKGYIGSQAAMRIDRNPEFGRVMSDLRPDIAARLAAKNGGRTPAEPPVIEG